MNKQNTPLSADPTNTKQWAGFERARQHARELRELLRSKDHGTAKSKRGIRVRINPEIRKAA